MSAFSKPMIIAGIIGALFSSGSQAAESTGFRKLLNVGCHLEDSTCFVLLDGLPVGESENCANTEIRWDGKSLMGKEHLSMMLMTLKSGGKASFNVSGCHGVWPTFNWAHYQ